MEKKSFETLVKQVTQNNSVEGSLKKSVCVTVLKIRKSEHREMKTQIELIINNILTNM